MGLQLIFVVETNKECKSDWIYIKDTIEHFYEYEQTQVKLTPVYMDGREKYKKKEAAMFKTKKLISKVDDKCLTISNYRVNASNIMKILDKGTISGKV